MNYKELSKWFHELSVKRSDRTMTKEELVDFINECKKINPAIPSFIDGSKAVHLTASFVGVRESDFNED